MNQVVAGEYKGSLVVGNKIILVVGFKKEKIVLNSATVETFEEVDRVEKRLAGKTIAGGALLGRTGALLGATSKNITMNCKVVFKDGKKSLLKIDHNTYEAIERSMYDDPDAEPAKMNPTAKKFYIAIVVVFVVLIIASIGGSKMQKEKLDDAKLKCQAIELMDGSEGRDEAWLNYYVAKNNCDVIYTNIYELDQQKFVEAVNGDYESHKNNDREVAGHKIDWYLEQVKNNQ